MVVTRISSDFSPLGLRVAGLCHWKWLLQPNSGSFPGAALFSLGWATHFRWADRETQHNLEAAGTVWGVLSDLLLIAAAGVSVSRRRGTTNGVPMGGRDSSHRARGTCPGAPLPPPHAAAGRYPVRCPLPPVPHPHASPLKLERLQPGT